MKSALEKNYIDTLEVLDAVVEYLGEDGQPTGLVSYAALYVDPVTGDDVIAEPYALEDGEVHYYNLELPENYVVSGVLD